MIMNKSFDTVDILVQESWKKIAPFWPLANIIAVNPLQGLQDLPIEKAMLEAAEFFEQKDLPENMQLINIQTIKWVQAFFDQGQATLQMPLRQDGLYASWKKLVCFDDQIHGGNLEKKAWILQLPVSSKDAIEHCFSKLEIPKEQQLIFLTLLLTTLPGWAAHIKYRNNQQEQFLDYDYLAIRMIMTTLLWHDAIDLIVWHAKSKDSTAKTNDRLKLLEKNETAYFNSLLSKLRSQKTLSANTSEAQLVFCIDVRSEPFRKCLEVTGNYETFGFAGFFGIPVSIHNKTTGESYASCPVLLKPQSIVDESPFSHKLSMQDYRGYQILKTFKGLYQSIKYNIVTSFALVESLGFLTGIWMALKTVTPTFAMQCSTYIKNIIRPQVELTPCLENILFVDQCMYAQSALQGIGITKNFSPLVVFCGHGSTTQNNAYATLLDCGACSGRHGGSNARILAKILNTQTIRDYLSSVGILIPQSTLFLAAEHNTTTDEFEIYEFNSSDLVILEKIEKLKENLRAAAKFNSQRRSKSMGFHGDLNKSLAYTKKCSLDWSQVRPEWGLARNASFIVGPRNKTQDIDLEGRAFLHSYNYHEDLDGGILTLILTAPMIVAQWINSQYLFSTFDNIAYGSGSKITQNIVGKIGVMQGSASDLMTGLPLQSVYRTDTQAYHEPVRLMTIVYAPCDFVDTIIAQQPELQNLFRNGWVLLVSIDPDNTNDYYFLERDLTWTKGVWHE
jgi:uncharacterized protein